MGSDRNRSTTPRELSRAIVNIDGTMFTAIVANRPGIRYAR